MQAKQLAKSKTVIFNTIVGAIVTILQTKGVEIPVEVATGVLAVGNFLLRLVTKEPISAKGVGKAAPLVVFFLLCSCAVTAPRPAAIPEGCENSIIWQHMDEYRAADFALKIANVQAVRENLYTRRQALDVIEETEAFLKQEGITCLSVLQYVTAQVEWIKYRAGVEIFIIVETMAKTFDRPVGLDECDRKLLLKHLAQQKNYLQML